LGSGGLFVRSWFDGGKYNIFFITNLPITFPNHLATLASPSNITTTQNSKLPQQHSKAIIVSFEEGSANKMAP
jgi:hypothetical protein